MKTNTKQKNILFSIIFFFIGLIILFFMLTIENKTIKNNKNLETMFAGRSGGVANEKNTDSAGHLSKESLLKLFDIFPSKKD